MASKKLTGTFVILLLLLSILSAVYLSVKQEVKRKSLSLDQISVSHKNHVGVIDIYGPIYSPTQSGGFGARYGATDIVQTLRDFKERPSIKAVILRINSPGGTVGAIQEITAEIKRVQESGKPVVASVADMAASGGYYIASVCDRVVVNPGSIVGSIGVIFTTTELSNLFDKMGVNMEVIKSGPYKDAGSVHRSLSEEERDLLQEIIDDVYGQFVEAVRVGRSMDIEKVRELAQGQIYSGQMAMNLGLVDELGDIMTAKKIADDLAGAKNTSFYRTRQPRWSQFLHLIEQRTDIFGLNKNKINGAAYLYRP